LSSLQDIVQSVNGLTQNIEAAANQLRDVSTQLSSMTASISGMIRDTSQYDYQAFMGRMTEAQNRLSDGMLSLMNVSENAQNWLSKYGNSISAKNHRDIPRLDDVIDDVNVQMDASGGRNIPRIDDTSEDDLKPSGRAPRDLPATRFGFTAGEGGTEVYDSPLEMDKYLYSKQGSAYEAFQGTCGLCSCANILRLAGADYGEKEMIDYAAGKRGNSFTPVLCSYNPYISCMSGGTSPKQRQQILDYFGVSSSVWSARTDSDGITSMETIEDIAEWISQGRGVIISVDAGVFYNNPRLRGGGHAVTVTSVERDADGNTTAFYILDSNKGTVKRSASDLRDALRSYVGINVTSQIIR